MVGAGDIGKTDFPTSTDIYVFRSRDHGQHWSSPLRVGGASSAHMLPAAVAGPRAEQLAVGYFRTTDHILDPNSLKGVWTYTTAESFDALAAKPKFTVSDVAPGVIYHRGDICNLGIRCGAVPGGPSDRSLLDFTAAALDRHFCPLFTFAGNPTGSPGNNTSSNTFNYVTRQTSGCFSTARVTGRTTRHRKHHRRHHRRHRARGPGFTG